MRHPTWLQVPHRSDGPSALTPPAGPLHQAAVAAVREDDQGLTASRLLAAPVAGLLAAGPAAGLLSAVGCEVESQPRDCSDESFKLLLRSHVHSSVSTAVSTAVSFVGEHQSIVGSVFQAPADAAKGAGPKRPAGVPAARPAAAAAAAGPRAKPVWRQSFGGRLGCCLDLAGAGPAGRAANHSEEQCRQRSLVGAPTVHAYSPGKQNTWGQPSRHDGP